MFGLLRRIWGGAEKPPKAEPAVTVVLAPPDSGQTVAAKAPAANDFVRRESLVNRAERIAGYEFSLFANLQDRLKNRNSVTRRAYDAALLTRLTSPGGASLLGKRLAFVNLAVDSLHEPRLAGLPPLNTVLMLDVSQPGADWPALCDRATLLAEQGFLLGLDVHDSSALSCPLMGSLDFIQVDVGSYNGLDLRELVARLRTQHNRKQERTLLVARNLQSHDEFQFSEKCGFDFFHGPFVNTERSTKAPERGGINRMVVLPILNMVRADESFAAIADQLKNEPTLSYKLLRYLNSPAMGLQMKIESLTEALTMIGREKFYRWMSLLLFDFNNPSYQERGLSERALARGRTLELLAGKGLIPASGDMLFLTGLFSLLDLAMQLPMADLLAQAALPGPVSGALLGQPGPLANALLLVTLGEADTTTDHGHLEEALRRCGLDDATYCAAANEALVWANQALGEAE